MAKKSGKQELAKAKSQDLVSDSLVSELRDPYFLDFLGLKDTYGEKIIRNN